MNDGTGTQTKAPRKRVRRNFRIDIEDVSLLLSHNLETGQLSISLVAETKNGPVVSQSSRSAELSATDFVAMVDSAMAQMQ